MFISNKYSRWYFSIISAAQSQYRIKRKLDHSDYIYYEQHHIRPRCMSGNNNKENLVLLTVKEHFLCHWLLIKMVETEGIKNKLRHAMMRMCYHQSRFIPVYLIDIARKEHAIATSKQMSGQPKTKEHIKNISKGRQGVKPWNKGKKTGPKGPNKSRGIKTGPRTQESIDKQKKTITGKKRGSYKNFNHSVSSKEIIIDNIKYSSLAECHRQTGIGIRIIRRLSNISQQVQEL